MMDKKVSEVMGIQMDLRKAHSEYYLNAGFPEFSEMPEFYQAPKVVDREWLESTLLSPEIRRLMEKSFDLKKV